MYLYMFAVMEIRYGWTNADVIKLQMLNDGVVVIMRNIPTK